MAKNQEEDTILVAVADTKDVEVGPWVICKVDAFRHSISQLY